MQICTKFLGRPLSYKLKVGPLSWLSSVYPSVRHGCTVAKKCKIGLQGVAKKWTL